MGVALGDDQEEDAAGFEDVRRCQQHFDRVGMTLEQVAADHIVERTGGEDRIDLGGVTNDIDLGVTATHSCLQSLVGFGVGGEGDVEAVRQVKGIVGGSADFNACTEANALGER